MLPNAIDGLRSSDCICSGTSLRFAAPPLRRRSADPAISVVLDTSPSAACSRGVTAGGGTGESSVDRGVGVAWSSRGLAARIGAGGLTASTKEAPNGEEEAVILFSWGETKRRTPSSGD